MKKTYLTLAAVSALVISQALPALAEGDMKGDMGEKHRMHMQEKFAKIDTDGNGSISKAEHADFAAKRFAEADANSDGELTKDEMAAVWKRKMEKFHGQHGEHGGMEPKTAPKTE